MILLAGFSLTIIKEIEVTYFDSVKSMIEDFWSGAETITIRDVCGVVRVNILDELSDSLKVDSSDWLTYGMLVDDTARDIWIVEYLPRCGASLVWKGSKN